MLTNDDNSNDDRTHNGESLLDAGLRAAFAARTVQAPQRGGAEGGVLG